MKRPFCSLACLSLSALLLFLDCNHPTRRRCTLGDRFENGSGLRCQAALGHDIGLTAAHAYAPPLLPKEKLVVMDAFLPDASGSISNITGISPPTKHTCF